MRRLQRLERRRYSVNVPYLFISAPLFLVVLQEIGFEAGFASLLAVGWREC